MTLIQAIQSPPSSVELDRGSPHLNGFGQIPETLKIPRPGQWLEGDVGLIQKWVHEMIEHVAAHPKPLLPVIEEFKDLIESSPAIFVRFYTLLPFCSLCSRTDSMLSRCSSLQCLRKCQLSIPFPRTPVTLYIDPEG